MTEEAKALRDITVARPFLYTHPDGTQQHFGIGVHQGVSVAMADNWYVKEHLLRDGEKMATPVDVSDPAATARRLASLEDSTIRLEAEVRQHKDRADRVEADLVEARTKADEFDAVAAERDELKAKNAALEADVERLTSPKTVKTPKAG